MTKVALLIGVSEYGSGLNPLPGAVRDIEAVQQVLQPIKGGFDEVNLLSNPNPPVMREAIETLFSGRSKNDIVLLFFSGHIVQDNRGKLHFGTSITCKNPEGELIRVSAVPATFVHNVMRNSPCQYQVVILDCCLDHVSAQEMTAHDNDPVDIKSQLGGEGRVILTSVTSSQNSFEAEGFDSSVYTRYLVEGIRTGAADLDSDGWILVDELHEYASNKVQVAAPAVKPEFYPAEDGRKIPLLLSPIDDPKLKYRQEVESWVSYGEISQAGRYILNRRAESLHISAEERSVIEAEALKPYQEYQEKLQQYEREFRKAIDKDNSLGNQEREKFKSLQQSLGLRDEDVTPIEERTAAKLANISQIEDESDEPAQSDIQSKANSVPITPSVVLLEDIPRPTVQSTNPTPESEQAANEPTQADIDTELDSLPSVPTTVLPEDTPIPTVPSTNPTPSVNFSSSLGNSQTTASPSSSFPNKFFVLMGIGGALVTLALAIGIFTHKSVAPPSAPADKVSVSSSPTPSPNPSPTATSTDPKPSPSPSASPESKVCTIFVNGNLRSEPTSFRDNVVESLREPLALTGKQTKGGWVEVKLQSGKLAWAHPQIIANEEEMKTCLSKKAIPITTIEDILPPGSP